MDDFHRMKSKAFSIDSSGILKNRKNAPGRTSHSHPHLPLSPLPLLQLHFLQKELIPEQELSTILLDNIIKEVDNCRVCLKDKETSNWIVSFGDSFQAR